MEIICNQCGAVIPKADLKTIRDGEIEYTYSFARTARKLTGSADKCEVQIAYAIGVLQPVAVYIDCFGTEYQNPEFINRYVRENYDLTPMGIIRSLDLLFVDYNKVSSYGHFGKQGIPWEM